MITNLPVTASDARHLRRALLPALCGGFLFAGTGHAQTLDSIEKVQLLTVETSMTTSYDDNLFRNDGSIVPKTNDIIVSPGLDVRYGRQLGLANVQTAGAVDYDIYTRTNGFDRFRLNIAGQATVPIAGRCEVQPFGRVRRQRADYGDVATTTPNYQTFSTLSARFSCDRQAGFFPYATIARYTTTNSTEFRDADQRSIAYSGGVGYTQPSIGTLVLYYMHTKSQRDNLGFDNNIQRIGATFERAVVPSVTLNVDLHWLSVDSTQQAIPNYHGLGWNGRVRLKPGSGLSLTLSTLREISNDPLVQAGYSVNTAYMLAGQVAVGGSTTLALTARHDNRNFKSDPILFPNSIGSDRQDLLVVEAKHRLTERIAIGAAYTHIARNTDTGFNEYTANVGAISAAYRF